MSCSFWIQRKKKSVQKGKQESTTSDKKAVKKQNKEKSKC